MRTEAEIVALVLHVASTNDGIRAVLLTGSRANVNIARDKLQDFDIIYIVAQIEAFVKDKHWIDVFGKRLMMQLPDEMTTGDKDEHAYHYLMLFEDRNRIDLTLFPVEQLEHNFKKEAGTVILLDKDNLFEKFSPAGINYLIKKPTEKAFLDCCNEFRWVSTYVAKGLCRGEVIYAKEMLEGPVRAMFLNIIEWHIGTLTAFSVSAGRSGRHIKQHLSAELYNKILATYPDGDKEHIWNALFLMANLFDELAKKAAGAMGFLYNSAEAGNINNYLIWLRKNGEG